LTGLVKTARLKLRHSENDVILSVDAKTVHTSQDLQGIIALHHAGDQVSLKIFATANRSRGREAQARGMKISPRS
jgi:S1-C subfamily serine protease